MIGEGVGEHMHEESLIYMDRLKRNIYFLCAFRSLSEKQSRLILKHITPEQSQVLGDIAANLLTKNLRLTQSGKTRLSQYKEFVYCVGARETTPASRLRCIKKQPEAALTLIEVTRDKIVRLCPAKAKK